MTNRQLRGQPAAKRGRRPSRPPTPEHLDKLELIKAVASEHFYRHGYAGTDLRGIAASADIHVASLYNYISSKQELLFMIMRDGLEGISSSLDAATEGVEEPLERLSRALRSHILHHARRRHLAWISHVELRSLTGDHRTEITKARKRYEDRWVAMVREGMETGALREGDPHIVVFGLLAVGPSVSRWYEVGGRVPEAEMVSTLTELMLRGLIRAPGPS